MKCATSAISAAPAASTAVSGFFLSPPPRGTAVGDTVIQGFRAHVFSRKQVSLTRRSAVKVQRPLSLLVRCAGGGHRTCERRGVSHPRSFLDFRVLYLRGDDRKETLDFCFRACCRNTSTVLCVLCRTSCRRSSRRTASSQGPAGVQRAGRGVPGILRPRRSRCRRSSSPSSRPSKRSPSAVPRPCWKPVVAERESWVGCLGVRDIFAAVDVARSVMGAGVRGRSKRRGVT